MQGDIKNTEAEILLNLIRRDQLETEVSLTNNYKGIVSS